MLSQHIPESYDYLFAKLHGMWAHAAQGENLKQLAGAATEENLLHQLEHYQLPAVTKTNFHQRIQEREFRILDKMRNHVNESMSRYLGVQVENIADENLKVLLNYHFFPDSDRNIEDLLIEVPGRNYLRKGLLEAENAKAFIAALPAGDNTEEVAEIVMQLDEDHDIMRAEAALDRLAFRYEKNAASGLSAMFRKSALGLVQLEIDITNCMMLLRNAASYHFSPERLEYLWIPGGEILTHRQLPACSQAKSFPELIGMLPAVLQELLHPYEEQELYYSEHALWNMLYHRSLVLFRDFSHPVQSVIAFPYLLHFETINLGRIFEGIRFALPFKDIMNMMIGECQGLREA